MHNCISCCEGMEFLLATVFLVLDLSGGGTAPCYIYEFSKCSGTKKISPARISHVESKVFLNSLTPIICYALKLLALILAKKLMWASGNQVKMRTVLLPL